MLWTIAVVVQALCKRIENRSSSDIAAGLRAPSRPRPSPIYVDVVADDLGTLFLSSTLWRLYKKVTAILSDAIK